MNILLVVLLGTSLFEQLVWYSPSNSTVNRFFASCAAIVLAACSSGLVALHPSLWTLSISLFSTYRIINLLRLVKNRTQTQYLLRLGRLASRWLSLLQVTVYVVARLIERAGISQPALWYCLATLQLIAVFVLLLNSRRSARATRAPSIPESYADRDLPTLSVAIPARNETDDLQACLEAVVASNYPKLEILVLDDCSQNKHTPEIIGSFAHAGVRFIAGAPPPHGWLAKNFAYEQLLEQANGELVLFCGVDIRLETDSLRLVVETMLHKKKAMLSWIPINIVSTTSRLEALLVQPGRYAWELSLPRHWLKRPPVLSSCWLIKRAILDDAGSFKAVRRSIRPEEYFARYCATHDDSYSFLQSSQRTGIRSLKSFEEQRATAIRCRYPQLHQRIELVALLTLAECVLLIGPLPGVVIGLVQGSWLLLAINVLICILLLGFYQSLVHLTYRRYLLRGFMLGVFAAVYDVLLLNYSLVKYEFGNVVWKGRNVCIPVMRIVPKLPFD